MATKRSRKRASQVPSAAAVGGSAGSWLVFEYEPTSLFSLKMSSATSSVGRSLVTPTFYGVKMAFIDAAFRSGRGDRAAELVHALAACQVRVGVPQQAALTHTIIKIRQEPKKLVPGQPYISAIAYREFVHFRGRLRWAFDLSGMAASTAELLEALAPLIHYIGKRGGFIQFLGVNRIEELGPGFTTTLANGQKYDHAPLGHVAVLDDFGPEADLDALNSYSDTPIKRDRHRRFVNAFVPLVVVNEGPGFTEFLRLE